MASNVMATRPVKACTECKQAKLRCDSKDKFPNPCSRCQSRHLFCTVDASFKRTPARKRLEAMSRELQELRNQREEDHPSSRTESTADSGPSTVEDDGQDDFSLSTPAVSLNGVLVDASVATEALRTFAEVFRPQLPVIGSLSADDTYQSQPFLFWTIVIIIACHLPGQQYTDMLQLLQTPYTTMLHQEILDAPLPLHKIQALLLLCHWPLPCETQTRDPSWLYCGVLIQAARFMSLDRQQTVPSLRSLGVASGSIRARINTWLGCFCVSTSLSLHLGLPPPIDSDLDFGSIHSFLKRQTAPPTFAMQVRVQLIVAKFTSLLNHDMGEGASSSFIRLLDTELDALRADVSLEDEQMRAVELGILGAKVHLYALVITKDSNNSSSRQIMLRTARDVALRIIRISTLAMRNAPPDGIDQELIRKQRCLPKNHYRCLAFATIFLLKFFHRRGSDVPEERQTVANHISMAQNLFKACATEPRDEYNRTARVFEVLGQESPKSIEPDALRLTHRMGVSIVFDAVSNASEARGKPVELRENETIQDEGAPEEPRAHERLLNQPSIEMEQHDTSSEFLRGFWSDPYMSLLSFDPTPLESEYQESWPSF
ncbi:Fungal-trans domain-containing protein [Fusarium sp. LHS14.1]|nr:Fungal-trans domain-containing protein [Fusarium sp. LHS14.1]